MPALGAAKAGVALGLWRRVEVGADPHGANAAPAPVGRIMKLCPPDCQFALGHGLALHGQVPRLTTFSATPDIFVQRKRLQVRAMRRAYFQSQQCAFEGSLILGFPPPYVAHGLALLWDARITVAEEADQAHVGTETNSMLDTPGAHFTSRHAGEDVAFAHITCRHG